MMEVIQKFWANFLREHPEFKNVKMPEPYHFCNNKSDADECAQLTVEGIKQATSPSLWWYNQFKIPMTQVDDLDIITDYDGQPKAIIQFNKIELVRFKDISADYARIEGEGDRSLQYWKKVHWAYYTQEMQPFGEQPTEDMIIVCQYFKTIYTD